MKDCFNYKITTGTLFWLFCFKRWANRVSAENAVDSYLNPKYKTDHPSILGALGMLPKTDMVDSSVMYTTFNWIWDNWSWPDTLGWDFPMTALTATRLGMPEKAIESLLMPVQTNTYLSSGHKLPGQTLNDLFAG